MDPVVLGLVLSAVAIIATLITGIPQVWFARRQTRIAVEASRSGLPVRTVDVLSRIRTNKKIRIGFIHYPPFVEGADDDRDSPKGLYVALLQTFLKEEGIEAQFQQLRFSTAVNEVVEDRQDVVLSIFQTPKRSRLVDFSAFMHTVSVSGVSRRTEERVRSQSDLVSLDLICVVCRDEIGHELLEDQLKLPASRLKILDTSNVADILSLVASKSADVAIADSLSCQHGLAARGAEGPRLKTVLKRRPLYLCQNGVMIGRDQKPLSEWLDRGLKTVLTRPEFAQMESAILEEYHPLISKL